MRQGRPEPQNQSSTDDARAFLSERREFTAPEATGRIPTGIPVSSTWENGLCFLHSAAAAADALLREEALLADVSHCWTASWLNAARWRSPPTYTIFASDSIHFVGE